MGSGYGACEDRGCGNVGSVQEVSTSTLICYIDHPTWDVHTKSTCVHCTLVASDKYILVPLFVYMYM